MIPLRSPTTGLPLRPDGPDMLTDGGERWPVLDGIPYLRTGRDTMVARLLALLDSGDSEGALVHALADADAWWDGPRPPEADRLRLVRERDALTLRAAMDLLALGRVGHYFAHRWSDPTYLAGLALLDAHWAAPRRAFELACGIGHYLRDLAGCGCAVAGGDVVFAKLWLARGWVAPAADLVCFDAASPWPVADGGYDLVLCHDAFYFLEPKQEILRRLRGLLASGGTLAIGHIHNRAALNLSAGAGVTADEIAGFFPDAIVYDDAELTRAAAERRAPVPRPANALREVEAFGLVEGGSPVPRPADGPLCRPPDGGRLRPNPLYMPERFDGPEIQPPPHAEVAAKGGPRSTHNRHASFEAPLRGAPQDEEVEDLRPASPEAGVAIRWPSDRYRAEYGPRATYRTAVAGPLVPTPDAIARREFVDLPERW